MKVVLKLSYYILSIIVIREPGNITIGIRA